MRKSRRSTRSISSCPDLGGAMPRETTATGKWREPGVPHKGWTCVGIEELEEQDHLCEMCEARHVRFVHVMQNSRYPNELRVGCVCAGHMEGDVAQAKEREKSARNRSSRRKTWISKGWRTSRKGNPYRNKEGLNASVFQSGRGWSTIVQNDHVKLSASGLPTEDAAKLKAFELFEQGQTILKRRP